jgi:hypothetical protein
MKKPQKMQKPKLFSPQKAKIIFHHFKKNKNFFFFKTKKIKKILSNINSFSGDQSSNAPTQTKWLLWTPTGSTTKQPPYAEESTSTKPTL